MYLHEEIDYCLIFYNRIFLHFIVNYISNLDLKLLKFNEAMT
jgi:hypothetical protein